MTEQENYQNKMDLSRQVDEFMCMSISPQDINVHEVLLQPQKQQKIKNHQDQNLNISAYEDDYIINSSLKQNDDEYKNLPTNNLIRSAAVSASTTSSSKNNTRDSNKIFKNQTSENIQQSQNLYKDQIIAQERIQINDEDRSQIISELEQRGKENKQRKIENEMEDHHNQNHNHQQQNNYHAYSRMSGNHQNDSNQNQSYYNAVVGNLNQNHNQNQSYNNDFNQQNYHRGHQYQGGYQNPAYTGSMQQGSQRKHHSSNHGQQQQHHHHHHHWRGFVNQN